MKNEVDSNNKDAIQTKKLAILKLGSLLSATEQAEGEFAHLVST